MGGMDKPLHELPLRKLQKMLKATAGLAGCESESANLIRQAIARKKGKRRTGTNAEELGVHHA